MLKDPDQLFKQINGLHPLRNVFFSPELNKKEDLVGYYRHNRGVSHYRRFCTAPWHQVNLLPNGDIYVCPDYLLGNIKRDCLREIWNGRKAKVLRRFLTKRLFPTCKGCFYFYCDRRS